MKHPIGKIILVVMLSFFIFLPNVYANPEQIVKQKNRTTEGPTERIVGGTVVPEDERTFQVALVREDGDLYCGGAIIGDSWVLTAAHCVESGETLEVLSDTQRLDEGGTLHSVAESHMHPNYTGSTGDGFDVALIQINGTFPTHLERLKIATPVMMSIHGTPGTGAVVSGWGVQHPMGDASNRLLQIVNHIISDTQCSELAGLGISSSTIICALDEGQSSCYGDSGGPFTITVNGEHYSAGVVSFGPSFCNGYAAYAETSALRHWINEYVDIDMSGELQPGIYRMNSQMTEDMCADVQGRSIDNGAPIVQWDCHDNDNQKWKIEPVGENYRFTALHSGQVLDVPRSSTEENIGIVQWPWNGGDNQQWTMKPDHSWHGTYEIKNVNSNLCLDVKYASSMPGVTIQQYGCHGRNNQRWRLELVQ